MKVPVECPVCGGYSMTQDQQASTLLAVCDVLTIKALAQIGKWLIRAERSRTAEWGRRPIHTAHLKWQPDDNLVRQALKGAWDVVPALLGTYGCRGVTSDQVVEMLDSYVHDLAITGTMHDIHQLYYRFETRLNLPVYLKEPDMDGADDGTSVSG